MVLSHHTDFFSTTSLHASPLPATSLTDQTLDSPAHCVCTPFFHVQGPCSSFVSQKPCAPAHIETCKIPILAVPSCPITWTLRLSLTIFCLRLLSFVHSFIHSTYTIDGLLSTMHLELRIQRPFPAFKELRHRDRWTQKLGTLQGEIKAHRGGRNDLSEEVRVGDGSFVLKRCGVTERTEICVGILASQYISPYLLCLHLPICKMGIIPCTLKGHGEMWIRSCLWKVSSTKKSLWMHNKGELLLNTVLVLPPILYSALYILLSWYISVIWLIYIIMDVMSATSRNRAQGTKLF